MFFGHCHRTRFRDSFCLASVFEMTVYLLTYLLTYGETDGRQQRPRLRITSLGNNYEYVWRIGQQRQMFVIEAFWCYSKGTRCFSRMQLYNTTQYVSYSIIADKMCVYMLEYQRRWRARWSCRNSQWTRRSVRCHSRVVSILHLIVCKMP